MNIKEFKSKETTDLALTIRTSNEEIDKWDRSRIVNALLRETSVEENLANNISKEVEDQIFSSKIKVITTSLVRELVNAKLIENGLEKERLKHNRLGIPIFDIEQMLMSPNKENANIPHGPESTNLTIAGSIKKDFCLEKVFSKDVTNAHIRGDIHIHDLSVGGDRPYSFLHNESIIIKEGNIIKVLCFEQLFNNINSHIIYDDRFEIKYINNIEILDAGVWVKLKRVVRHKTNKKLLAVNTVNGRTVVVTEDHPFIKLVEERPNIICPKCNSNKVIDNGDNYLCKDCNRSTKKYLVYKAKMNYNITEKVEAKKINTNNYIITPNINYNLIKNNKNPKNLADDFCWLLGIFIAEGSRYKNRIKISNSDSTIITKVKNILEKYNILYTEDFCVDTNITRVYCKAKDLYLDDLYIRQGSENIALPVDFLNLPDNLIGSMISGVIDGDSFFKTDNYTSEISIRLTSKLLLSQIQIWLDLKGIKSYLTPIDNYGPRIYKSQLVESKLPLYCLRIYFKQEDLAFFKESLKINCYNMKLSKVKYNKHDDVSKVSKIKDIKNTSKYVYDVTTESGTFTCSGIWTSNCSGQSLEYVKKFGLNLPKALSTAKPANKPEVLLAHMVKFSAALQCHFAGAIGWDAINVFFAPYLVGKTDEEIKQLAQMLIFEFSQQAVARGGQSNRYNSNLLLYNTDINRFEIHKIGEFADKYLALKGIENEEGSIGIDEKYKILSFNRETGKVELKPVYAVIRHRLNTNNLYKVKTSIGHEICVTEDHGLFNFDDKGNIVVVSPKDNPKTVLIPARIDIDSKYCIGDNIDIKDILPLNDIENIKGNSLKIYNKILLSKEFIRIIGYYIADGWTTIDKGNVRVNISILEKEKIEDLTDCVQKAFNLPVFDNSGVRNFSFGGKTHKLLFSTLCGRISYLKRIPEFILFGNEEIIKEFLSSYLSCDGYISGNRIGMDTVSEILFHELCFLFYRLGIIFSTRKRMKKVKEIKGIPLKSKKLQYEITIGKEFFNKLYFKTSRKEELRQKQLNSTKLYGQKAYNYSTNYDFRSNKRRLKFNTLKKLNDGSPLFNRLLNLLPIEVKSIEKVAPEEFVYDISVRDNENFMVNGGIFAHNSIFSDINLYWEIPEHFKNTPAIGPGGKYTGKKYKDYTKESQKFVTKLFEIYNEGDSTGKPFFFPKPLCLSGNTTVFVKINSSKKEEEKNYEKYSLKDLSSFYKQNPDSSINILDTDLKTGCIREVPVKSIGIRQINEKLIRFKLYSNMNLDSIPEHTNYILENNKIVKIKSKDVRIGHLLLATRNMPDNLLPDFTNNFFIKLFNPKFKNFQFISVKDIKTVEEDSYYLEVDHPQHSFLLSNGILTSNCHITEELFKTPGHEEYLKLICSVAAKMGNPYFVFDRGSTAKISECCFHSSQKVLVKTSKGIVHDKIGAICKINTKELEVFYKGNFKKAKPVITTHDKFIKVQLSNGYEMFVTDNHICPTYNGDKEAKDLTTNDYLPINFKEYETNDNLPINFKEYETNDNLPINFKEYETNFFKGKENYGIGYCIGAYLVNGSCESFYDGNNNKVTFCLPKNKQNIIDKIVYFAEIFKAYITVCPENAVHNISLSIISHTLKSFIKEFVKCKESNYIGYGKNILSKSLNNKVYEMSYYFRKGLIDGYFDTESDSSNNKRNSVDLVDDINALHTTLGIPVDIVKDDNTNYCIRSYEQLSKNNKKHGFIFDNKYYFFQIKKIEHVSYDNPISAYCFEMENTNEPYFTLANGIETHNCRLSFKLTDKDLEDAKEPWKMRYCAVQNVTINLPRIGYFSVGEKVFDRITKVFNLIIKAHLQKYRFIKKLLSLGNYGPLSLLVMNKDGDPYLKLDKVSYLVGMVGLNELVKSQCGCEMHESDEAFRYGIQIIAHMKLLIDKAVKEHGLHFVLEQTPAESCHGDVIIQILEKNIFKLIKIGDFIDNYLTKEGSCIVNNLKIVSVDNELKAKFLPITRLYKHKRKSNVYKVSLKSTKEILITDCHSIYVLEKNDKLFSKTLKEFKVGDKVVLTEKSPFVYDYRNHSSVGKDIIIEEIVSIDLLENQPEYVYDIEVKDTHNFVAANGILLHNSTAHRFARLDLKYYPEKAKDIVQGNISDNSVYYTNSTQLNIGADIGTIERITKEGLFHPLIEAGSLSHIWLGESQPDPESLASFVKKVFYNTKNDQIAFSPEFTCCNSCGKVSRGLLEKCPYCSSEEVEGITRITGYFSKISGWNKGKLAELKNRKRTPF